MQIDSGAVILGAGFSRRFGADKRLAQLNGKTIAELTLQVYCGVFESVRVVVKPEDKTLISLIKDYPADIIPCPEAHQGMGHSLACGIRDLPWSYAFIGLLDMPFIQTETLLLLIEAARTADPETIIVPQLADGLAGHPVGWPQHYFPLLEALKGDQGARSLLARFSNAVQHIPTVDMGIVRDIDHPSDMQAQP